MIAASLMLGVVHLFVWQKQRSQYAHLLFFVLATSAAAYGAFELARMRAETPASLAALARWSHVPLAMVVISIVGFVRLYFDAGRLWLAYAVIGIRLVALALNFLTGVNVNFREITALDHLQLFGGAVVAGPIGIPNPWAIVPQLSNLLLVAFIVDASITPVAEGRNRGAPPRGSRRWQSCSLHHDGCQLRRTGRHRSGARAHHPHARLLHRRTGDGLRAGLGPHRCGAACGAAPRKRAALPRGRRSGSERDSSGRWQRDDHVGECAGRDRVRLPECGTRREAGRNADSGTLSYPARRTAGRLRQRSAGASDGGRTRAGRVPKGWRRNPGGSLAQSDADKGWIIRTGVGRRHHRAQKRRAGNRPPARRASRTCRGSRCWASCPDRSRTSSTSR